MNIYTQKKTNTRFIFVLVCLLMPGFACHALAVDEPNQSIRIVSKEEMPVILNLISTYIRENYENIKTWSGEIEKNITWVHSGSSAENVYKKAAHAIGEAPQTLVQKAEDKIKFAVDKKKNFVFVNTLREKPSKFLDYKSGNEVGDSGPRPISSSIIAKPDFLLKAEDYIFAKKTGHLLHNKVEKKSSDLDQRSGLYKGTYDPRKVFFPSGGFTWNIIDSLIQRIDKYGQIEFDGYRFKIEEYKEANDIEYKIIEPSIVNMERRKPEDYAILTKIFSRRCGFNITYWEAATGDGKPIQIFKYEYEYIDGIYLPKKVLEQIYKNETVIAEYESIYNNNKVNQELSPGTFELTNLKLIDGDVLADKISNKEYEYKDSNLIFVKGLPIQSNGKQETAPPKKIDVNEPNKP
ncbi:MAG: hypothetical protein ABSB91_02270 [Sedimentisphaerales bacterium]